MTFRQLAGNIQSIRQFQTIHIVCIWWMPVPSGWWYHLSVIEPTRQVLVASHWTVPLSCIPNSSYTHHKLDHNHDPYPSPSLVNIYGGELIRAFHSARPHLRHRVKRASSLNLEHMVASHCYYPGKPSSPMVEVQTFTIQSTSYMHLYLAINMAPP